MDNELGIEHLIDVESIGHGGFSWVYAATDTQLDRRVAVKLLSEIKTDADRERFDRECAILGRLSSHPNIVTVHSAGYNTNNRPYLIMELVPGGSIDDMLERNGPIGWAAACGIVEAVAGALQSAHDQGVLHRDVKPENILLDGQKPLLADFGIASLQDGTGATSTKVTASWLHAPPETFENRRDERSDLYSLASTLYTMIGGSAPFWRPDEESLNPLVYRLMHEPAHPLRPEIAPPALNQLLMASLAKDPSHRPSTMTDFARALAAISGGSHIAPVPQPGPGQAAAPHPGATQVVGGPGAMPAPGPSIAPVYGAGAPVYGAGAPVGAQAVGPQPVGSQPVGPIPVGPQSVGPQPVGPMPGGPASVGMPPQVPQANAGGLGGRGPLLAVLGVLAVGLVAAVGAFVAFGSGGNEEAGSEVNPLVDDQNDTSNDDQGVTPNEETTTTTVATTTTTTTPPTTLSLLERQASTLTGTWQGSYVCTQGATGVTLSIDARTDGTAIALFEFYAVPENPGVPSGRFTMTGTHVAGRLNLIGDRWIEQPANYIMGDLSAMIGNENDPLTGLLDSVTGACTTFAVERIDDQVPSIP